MATLQPYKKYNAIEYDYATALPDGWQLLPNIAIFQERKERGTENEETLSISAIRGIVKSSDYENRKDRTSDDKSQYLLVKEGDLAYNTMLMWDGAVGHSSFRGIVSPAYTVLKSKMKINPTFFHYQMRTEFYKNYSRRFSYGIVDARLRLYYVHFKRMYSIVPPLDVQNIIVEYLDKKNNEIEKFIRNKEQLIEIILERQENEISNIITKGNQKSELRDSGSVWLGSIPSKWNLIQLGYLLKYISYGFTNPMPTTDEGPFMLTANDVGDGEIFYSTCRRTSEKEFKKLSNKSVPINDDILVTKDGTLGRTSIFNGEKSCINQSVALLRVSPKHTSSIFIETALRSKCYQDKMIYDAEGTTIKHIYITKLVKMKIALPSKEEQNDIVNIVNSIRNENRNTIQKISKEISAIKEYREALITDLVTGKRSIPQLRVS